jgi:putative spermidine/putrescine transport system permease protein
MTSVPASAGQTRQRGWLTLGWPAVLLAVPLLFLAIFFLWPLCGMVLRSLTDPSASNYVDAATTPLDLKVLWATLRTAFLVTVITLAIGYPYAYVMTHAPRLAALLLLIAILLPFWSSLLVRTYAWTILLRDTGVINTVLDELGLIGEPLPLMQSSLGVLIGMVHVLLPFMVLPLVAAMRSVEPALIGAANTLGAGPLRAFREVYAPLTIPGVFAGCLLVFVLSLGFYITPAVLGGLDDVLYSQLIVTHVSDLLEFGRASAMSVILLLVTLALIALGTRWVGLDRLLGREGRA